jgi:Sec-independent protein secretion pathway component TatC
MAIPLMILYEFSIFIARFAEKKHPEADDTKEDVKKSEEET